MLFLFFHNGPDKVVEIHLKIGVTAILVQGHGLSVGCVGLVQSEGLLVGIGNAVPVGIFHRRELLL